MKRAEERAKSYCKEKGYKSEWIKPYLAYIEGYEQAIKDIKETFDEMSKNTNSAIDAVKALGSLLGIN